MNLKLIRTALGTVAFSIVAVGLPSVAEADGSCDPSQGPCILEPVVISGGCGAGCVGTGFGGGWGLGGDGGGTDPWQSAAGSASSSTTDKAIKLIKKVIAACKKADESCGEWAARMLTPAGLPVLNGDGIPTGKTGMGICTIAGFSASICYINISEIAENPVACALLSCPAG